MANTLGEEPAYRIEKELFHRGGNTVCQATRRRDGFAVLIELGQGDDAGNALREECRLLRTLPRQSVLPDPRIENVNGVDALVCDDPGGSFLSSRLDGSPMGTGEFLDLALAIGICLKRVHDAGVVHRALQPECIYLESRVRGVRLTGFASALSAASPGQDDINCRIAEGSLTYLAPEQTGFVNCLVDSRCDLYALGILFYRLLTGHLPFESEQALDLVHAHIASQPEPPDSLVAAIPGQLSAMVLRLLAKDPEQRYRSAAGLAADLRRCRDELRDLGYISDFALGEEDPMDHLPIPHRLYGREQSLSQLLSAFERCKQGGTEWFGVFGYSGVGKSSLVLAMRQSVVLSGGRFTAGKFDQLNRDQPYSALFKALGDLARQMLGQDSGTLKRWRESILTALGANAGVITQVVPDLELVIGSQPPVPRLSPIQGRNRLELQFQRLLAVLCSPAEPLVLFLDDLQWADIASLELMVTLLSHDQVRGLLVIGAYRDNEVDSSHPLSSALRHFHDRGVTISTCPLSPLSTDHLRSLLGDTFGCSASSVDSLADLLREKTLGNPFFTRAFLQSAFVNGLIRHTSGKGWEWDSAEIRRAQPTDNVVELMANRIVRLPEDSQRLLEVAACIGNGFDQETLTLVEDGEPQGVRHGLLPALKDGLIESQGQGRYRFSHDRIQEAAYGQVPVERRAGLHRRIAELLLAQFPDQEIPERLFEITDQLNRALDLLRKDTERRRAADLNLAAGSRARRSAAFEAALRYFDYGIQALGEGHWERDYDAAFALHLGRAENAFLCGATDIAEADTEQLLTHARSDLERGEVHALSMVRHETAGCFGNSVTDGLAALALFGIHFPDGANKKELAIPQALTRIEQLLMGREIGHLLALPEMQGEELKMCMRLLMTLWPSAYIAGDKPLTVLIAARMVELSLRHGNTPESAYGYVTHAITLGALSRDYAAAYAFGRLALAVNDRFDDLRSRAKINHMFSCYIGFWRRPIAESFPYSSAAYSSGLESGDFVYAAYGCFHESWHALFSGMELDRFQREYAAKLDFLERSGNRSFYDAHRLMLAWGRGLQGESSTAGNLQSRDFDEPAYLDSYRGVDFFLAFHHIARLQLLYCFGDLTAARAMLDQARQAASGIRGMIWDAWLCFYGALTLTAGGNLTADDREQLDLWIELMRLWAKNSPSNFEHQYRLLLAERAVLVGQSADAIDAYEAALDGADTAGFVHHRALIRERYGEFWLRRGNRRLAYFHLEDALADYRTWGAQGKAAQLIGKHRGLIGNAPPRATAKRHGLDLLDAQAMATAASALSGEIDTTRLMRQLLKLLLQTTGARLAVLFVTNGGELIPEMEGRVKGGELTIGPPVNFNWKDRAEERILNYVHHSLRPFHLGATESDRTLLPERETASLGSVLCVPVLNRGELEALLYLNNELVENAFTPQRQMLVQTLAAQAAISLRNAHLFEGLQQESRRRDRAEARLREVAAGTASAVGGSFFRELVQHLSRALDVRMAFVTECLEPEKLRVRALAFIDQERFLDDVEYELTGTPCRDVIDGETCFYPDRLAERFPKEEGLTSYLGVPMTGADGEVVGHLAVVDDKPMVAAAEDEDLLRIFAARAAAELQRQRAQSEADHARILLEERQRLAAIGEFASMIAHEIRSPLTTIGMALDFLENVELPPNAEKRIRLALNERDRLQSLLSEMLLYAKPQVLQRESIDLTELARETLVGLGQETGSETCRVDALLPKSPMKVSGDRDKLKQVLINLLTNALQATGPNERVSLQIQKGESGGHQIEIRNPGQIPPETLARLTEPFFTTKAQGTGLGLAIVQRILEAHDGNLSISCTQKEYICAAVLLPHC